MTTTAKLPKMTASEAVEAIKYYNRATMPEYVKGTSSESIYLDYGIPTTLSEEDAAILQDCRFTIKQKMEGRDGIAFRANLGYRRTYLLGVHNEGCGGSDFFEDYDEKGRAAMKFFQELADRVGFTGYENVTELCTAIEILGIMRRAQAKAS